jgi:hypothetical protein
MSEFNSIFRAAIPEPFVILGLKMKPFSLGHYITLRRHESAFVADTAGVATREDLIFACLVCSMEFDEFTDWLEGGKVVAMDRLSAVVSFCVGKLSALEMAAAFRLTKAEYEVMRWGRKIGLFDLQEKVALFKRYQDEHSQSPKYWIEKEGGENGSHWSHDMFVTLTGQLGFTRNQALNMSLREAQLHFFKHAETAGVVRLMTDSEIEAINGSTSIP